MNVIPSAQRSIETLALSIAFGEGRQRRQVVDNVNILLGQGESYGLIGESGCGKSTLLRALAGLNHHYQGHILLNNREQQHRRDKGCYRDVQMVFQDPYASLHPRKMVGTSKNLTRV
ncbi:ATP-binding cassette domain-containing protein [Sodalis endosymbiont of Spalangia cameroni]|uniref:ATP-binding cassette domain-containing protein n=1 Tax=Sodalis praecaptivus TaxID=1239307 RepID=UPI0031F8F7BC